ncbi:eukaryotic translation initiation factor 4E type 3 [Dermacentor silvarum]|uniref:eukaryotic translation initiation factor 4E type 3 n=1 Tax=Dermacentor silvarum TaxID=543639 RepID=UPI0018989CD3|nr:eukaryotic translation initiation factor 4E type 3 [Dermacentor silvarum]
MADAETDSRRSVDDRCDVKPAAIPDDGAEGVPLQTEWTFWLDKIEGRGISAAEYTASLKKIYTVNTVQGFWAVLHHIPDVCELGMRHTYHLMRGQRRPLWEDPENQRGGTWRIRCHKKHTPVVWKELILAAIGEQFAEDVRPGDDICGVSVCVREKDDIVQLWNADARLSEGATVLARVHALLPQGVNPIGEFYKPHQSRLAFEGGHKKMSR